MPLTNWLCSHASSPVVYLLAAVCSITRSNKPSESAPTICKYSRCASRQSGTACCSFSRPVWVNETRRALRSSLVPIAISDCFSRTRRLRPNALRSRPTISANSVIVTEFTTSIRRSRRNIVTFIPDGASTAS